MDMVDILGVQGSGAYQPGEEPKKSDPSLEGELASIQHVIKEVESMATVAEKLGLKL
jgi:hypothetical protein